MPEPATHTPYRGWLRVIATTSVIVLLALLVTLGKQAVLKTKISAAIAETSFADGLKVEVIRCELSSKLSHKPPHFFTWALTSESIGLVQSKMNFSTKEVNGSFFEFTMGHQNKLPGLMLLLRATLPDGKTFVSDHFIADEGKDLLHIRRKGTRFVNCEKIAGLSAHRLCQLLIDVEDGADGWLPFCGPVFADSKDAHAIALRTTFPRNLPTLRLRFQKPGQAPVEMSVPNPGYKTSFAQIHPEAVPAVRDSARYHIELTQLNVASRQSNCLTFNPNFIKDSKAPFDKVTLRTQIFVEDMQGNHIDFSEGYTLLPGHHLARVQFQVRPTASTYPWNISEVTVIAEGNWDKTGTMATAAFNSQGRDLGFSAIDILPARIKTPLGKTKHSPLIDIKIEGTGDSYMWSRVKSLCPNASCAMFSDLPEVIGSMNSSSWSVGSNSVSHKWSFPSTWSGTARPNSFFYLALVPETKQEQFEFIVDLAPLVK